MSQSHTIQRIVFWQNVLSIHQSAFVRELAEIPGLEVWFAYEEDLPESRKAMGWTIPDYGKAKEVDVRDAAARERLWGMCGPETCHAFGGYIVLPVAGEAFRRLRGAPCRKVWISEAFDFRGWRGGLRTQRVRWYAWRHGTDAFHRIFAMGSLGVGFFRRCGYPASRVREFAYLVESPSGSECGRDSDGDPFRVLYVGQLIPRKGVDLLLQALARLDASYRWRLDVVGDGPDAPALAALAGRLGISSKVTFHGNAANPVALRHIAGADCLVLPSRWDGWGAVINEALIWGTPVIAADTCGAASLLVEPWLGAVFPSGNTEELRARLQSLIDSAVPRERIRQWAAEALSPLPLVRFFIDELHAGEAASVTAPPWRQSNHLNS